NPAQTPSVIDGQGARRGVLETTTSPGNVTLVMDGFTIQNCVGGTIPLRGGTFFTDAHGGGMLSEQGNLTLSNVIFKNNLAQAANTPNATGGIAAGGGLGVFSPTSAVRLTNVTFTGNRSLGGTGSQAGGFGQGGGLFTDNADVVANNVTFTNN